MAKRLELLKQVVPSMTRAGVLLASGGSNSNVLEVMGATAKALKVGLQPIEVRKPSGSRAHFRLSPMNEPFALGPELNRFGIAGEAGREGLHRGAGTPVPDAAPHLLHWKHEIVIFIVAETGEAAIQD